MKTIKQSVELIGYMVGYDEVTETFEPNPEKLIEAAGRTCYKSEDRITEDSHKDFIAMVCKRQHESVLEHSYVSMRIVTDRGVMAELTRHRLSSFSVESTRYVNYTKDKHGSGDIQFILPVDLKTPEQLAFFLKAYEVEQNLYNEAIELGCTPQQARDLLPQGLRSELVMSANFREWKHILTLRTSPAAHPKMRELAEMMEIQLKKLSPTIFDIK